MYDDDEAFLTTLECFVAEGWRAGETVIVIATSLHLNALEERLQVHGEHLINARAQGHYFPISAEEMLSRFIVSGWPDQTLFEQAALEVLGKARASGRPVRAFGEMVALLWERGEHESTLHLENLWNHLRERESFALFCAYPRAIFDDGTSRDSLKAIRCTHSTILSGSRKQRPKVGVAY
jgi:hypothetical protein